MWRSGVGGGFLGRRAWALVGDGAAAPAGMGSEAPVVEHEIAAGAWGQGGEPFEEFEGIEEEVTGTVGPLALELQQDVSVAGETQPLLGDR